MAKPTRKLRPWTKEDIRTLKTLAREKAKTSVIASFGIVPPLRLQLSAKRNRLGLFQKGGARCDIFVHTASS
jgi:hypothetical protein